MDNGFAALATTQSTLAHFIVCDNSLLPTKHVGMINRQNNHLWSETGRNGQNACLNK